MTGRKLGQSTQYELSPIERDLLARIQALADRGAIADLVLLQACTRHSRECIELALKNLIHAGLVSTQPALLP